MLRILFSLLILCAMAAAFIVIARKGRALRKSEPLPPEATHGYLLWQDKGHRRLEITPPFYMGNGADCNLVLPEAGHQFEVCIFQHKKRFAFQCLEEADSLLINGDERIAGYLRDGDTITIGKRTFVFRCD